MKEIKLGSCPDCATPAGQPHKSGCDVERCSVCGGQWISCGHKKHDANFARWSGFCPGELEAKELEIDLNEFYGRHLNEVLFIKPV